MPKDKVVEIQGLSFTYGCHPVLEDVNLSISAGEVVGITGPNGSGKSTLLKLMIGQLRPQSGIIRIFGQDAGSGGWRRWVSYVPQKAANFNQSFPATVREVILSGRTGVRGLFKRFNPADYQAADEAMELMGIKELAQRTINALSGGQQQRVLISRALAAQPRLLLLDEPTIGVDVSSTGALHRVLKQINREKNITLILVSHDMEVFRDFISRQVCLDFHLCTCNTWEISAGAPGADSCSVYPRTVRRLKVSAKV